MQNAFGAAPTTFIPPFNNGDTNTLKVLSELGFTVYSSYPSEFNQQVGSLTLKGERPSIGEDATYQSLVSQTEPLLKDTRVSDIVITYHNWRFEGVARHTTSTPLE